MAKYFSTGRFDEIRHHIRILLNFRHFCYSRDKTEELKQLTPTERQEMKNQDARNNYGTSTYDRMSRRRERALKIYVDSSPKKRDE